MVAIAQEMLAGRGLDPEVSLDAPLGPEWKDHPLKGEWQGHRECHVGGDFLLIYRVEDIPAPGGGVFFTRAGTHSELFK